MLFSHERLALRGGLPGLRPVRGRRTAPPPQDLRVYYCNNLAILTVRVFADRVEIATPARSAALPRTAKGSNMQYSNGTVSLSGLEERIRLEEPGITIGARACQPKCRGRMRDFAASTFARPAATPTGHSKSIPVSPLSLRPGRAAGVWSRISTGRFHARRERDSPRGKVRLSRADWSCRRLACASMPAAR